MWWATSGTRRKIRHEVFRPSVGKQCYVSKPKLPLRAGLLGNCGGYRCPVCYTQSKRQVRVQGVTFNPSLTEAAPPCSSRWSETLDPEKGASRPEKGASRGMKTDRETARVALARFLTLRRGQRQAAGRRRWCRRRSSAASYGVIANDRKFRSTDSGQR